MHDPFLISADTKSKLGSFRYVNLPQLNMPIPDAEDNMMAAPKQDEALPAVNPSGDTPKPTSQTKPTTQQPENNPCPQTPAHRIPLADLISNTEDAFNCLTAKTYTPEDHVYWDHRGSNPKDKGSSPLAARKKKRCRSSSPTSSPLNADSKPHLSASQAPPRKLMKTPQHDVAADLWTKYLGKNNRPGDDTVPKIHFSQLVSSPQTPAPAAGRNSRSSGGLRRTSSCTADWPTSESKKRRLNSDIQANNNRIRDGFARSRSSILESGNSKASRIGMLIEKIQESLVKRSEEDIQGPSSSSPLPERPDYVQDRLASPTKDFDAERQLETPSKSPAKRNHPPAADLSFDDEELEQQMLSSEFGDDDLDNVFLELAVASPEKRPPVTPQADDPRGTANEAHHSHDEQVGAEAVAVDREQSKQVPEMPPPPQPSSQYGSTNDDVLMNGFDDDDDDDFLPDGIDAILAECDDLGALPAAVQPDTIQQAPPGAGGAGTEVMADNTNIKPGNLDEFDSEDTYGDDEFDAGGIDLEELERNMLQSGGGGLSATQATSSQRSHPSPSLRRYLILDLAESSYVNNKGRTQLEKVLFVQEEKTQFNRAISLRDSWFESPFTKGSYVHLIGDFDSNGHCIVDNTNNLIVLHPDHLVSATVVADSFTCTRRAVLQDRVKVTSEASKPQVYGHILHEIFQEAMKANAWDLDSLAVLIENTLVKYVESLYEINVSIDEATEYLKSKMPAMKAWADAFLHVKPSTDSFVEDKNGTKAQMSINKLLDVEEQIWSPMYGLKGNVDATVQVTLQESDDERTLTVPLEVKTGWNDRNECHRAQTALYCLLLSDRYDIDVTFGVLYYLEVSRTLRVRAIQGEIRQMIQQRNQLAGYIHHRSAMPPMLKKARICNQCYAKPTCFAFHKLVDDGDGDTSGMGNAFTDFVDHLTPSHQTFFRKWETLLTAEEKDMMRFRRELWTMIGSEREAVGRCFSNIVIEPGSAFEDKDAPKINRFRYTFVKQNAPHGFSFGDSQITVGEPIVVSDEKGHFALAMGFVVQVSRRRITVSVNRKLHDARTKAPAFDADRNQAFTGIMEIVEDEAGRPSTIHPAAAEDTIVYRLDKDEFSNGMATARNNLVRLMDKDLFQASRLRELIVDCAAPSFRPPSAVPILPAASYSGLNVDQKRALDKVMSADDYALVLGMPGTGKTTTIAQIIRAIVSQGKTVLLTSYTHTAVDNILLKIQDDNIRTLRIGALSKVHPDVRKFADLTGVPKKTIEELQDSYEKSVVVATTCLGVNHPIFHHRTFDYCIVDEASQITLPVCLGPIRMAKTFILVGDHHQLPPLVQSKEAGGGGLDISLFKLLCDAQPSSVVNLEHQYRMCEEIMLLSNTLIYSGALKCGTPAVASRSLDIPDINALKRHHANPLAGSPSRVHSCMGPTFGQCWLRDLLDSSAKARLVNTDQLHPAAVEVANGSRIVNSIEAAICTQLVEALISTGIPAREIGVVTLYRSQLALLRQNLRHRLPDLEMHTADRFQGRDKEVIIMSCVRSNSERNVGDLLRDRRRVNVAFTRARTKMLIVGSKTTLSQGNELLNKFVKLMEVKGWCYDLPPRAVEGHVFEDLDAGVSQTSPVVHRKTVRFGSPLKKNAFSPGKKQRLPLSPVKNRQSTVAGIRKPEKFGGRLMDAGKILSKRPVLADVLNDMLG